MEVQKEIEKERAGTSMRNIQTIFYEIAENLGNRHATEITFVTFIRNTFLMQMTRHV